MREPRGLGAGPVDRYEFDRDKFIIATCAQSSAKLPPHRLTVLEGSDTQRNVEKCVRMRAPAALFYSGGALPVFLVFYHF